MEAWNRCSKTEPTRAKLDLNKHFYYEAPIRQTQAHQWTHNAIPIAAQYIQWHG